MQINHSLDFSHLNILIIGDVMIDRYLSGQVRRISPEAPVPVLNFEKSENRLGGAANVALNIKAMAATPYLCSVVGKDKNAHILLEELSTEQINAEGIITSKERITTVKTRVLAQNQHLLRIDEEDTFDLKPTEESLFLKKIKDLLDRKKIHLILFQDYNKGVLTPSLIKSVLQEAQHRQILTAVDPKFNNFWAYQGVTLFKPNLKEVRDSLPFDIQTKLSNLQQAADFIRKKLDNTYTLITLSEKGLFINSATHSQVMPTFPRQIADVCGAGDTVVSIAALALASGRSMEDVARLANLAGGQVCEKVGVVPVDKEQLEREYSSILKKNK